MEIIQHIKTRSGKNYFTKSITFTQGGHIGAEIIDIRNKQEVFIDCVLIDYIHICNAIEAENVPFPIPDRKPINLDEEIDDIYYMDKDDWQQ